MELVIGLDGDDTLWRNEEFFEVSQEAFRRLVAPYLGRPRDIDAELAARERQNLELFGYGVKGFVLSSIETAIEVTEGRIDAAGIQQIIDIGKAMLREPTQLLDGVEETVRWLAEHYPLILVTKGDLMNQEQKVARSGLADLFHGVEIVSEKDPATYRRVLQRHRVDPACFVMVGNSVKSDILPVLEIGGRAVHVPAELTWVHEVADHDGSVPTISNLRELPALLERLATNGR